MRYPRPARALALLMLLATLFGPVQAQELKIATLAPDGSSWMNELRKAAEQIQSGSDQRVRIRYYPGGVMGDANAVLRRMRLGQLQGGAFTVGDLAGVSTAVNLYGLPFMFRDESEVLALRETFDALILADLEQAGLVAPALSMGGFAYLFSREAIPDPQALTPSWRVWVPTGDDLSRRTLERAGVGPVPLPLAEVYTALQTGAVNTFASTLSGAIILQWHTRARQVLDLPILMTAGTLGIDQRAFNRLTPADQALVRSAFADALGRIESLNRQDNEAARAALAGQGISLNPPTAAQAEAWRSIAEETRRQMIDSGQLNVPHLAELKQALERLRGD